MADNPVAWINLELNLTSASLSPEEISDELGFAFDVCRRLGEPRGRTTKRWDANHWILEERTETDYASGYDDLVFALDRLTRRVEHQAEVFARLAADGSAVLSVVIHCEGYPGMGIPSELLRRLSRLNVGLDFDLYCERSTDMGESE